MTAADLVVVALRALGFVAVLQAAGVPFFLWLYGDELARARRSIASLGVWSAGAGLLLTAAYQFFAPARLTGTLAGAFDSSVQMLVLGSDAGAAAGVRILGLAMVAAGCLKNTRTGAAAGLVGGTLVVVSFALMGHTAEDDQRWLLSMLLIVHLLVVAYWYGALWPFGLASRHEPPAVNGALIERFSRDAVWLVPLIFVAGFVMSVALLPRIGSLRAPYGLLLLGKIGGFALLMGLATLNKWRFGPLIRAGNASALSSFRRSVLAEWLLIAAVLCATAAMTALFSPGH